MKARRFYRNRKGTNLAEFPVAMLVFFMFIVFPLLNLVFYAAAAGTVAFITTQAAGAAAGSGDYNSALAAMQSTTNTLSTSGWGRFARLVPSGGYQNCGADLYVVKTALSGGNAISYYGPNTPDPNAPDPTNFIYEYRVRTNFSISPFMNLAAVPFIGAVPMVGSPAPLSWCVERSVEYTVQNVAGVPGGFNGGNGTPINPGGGGGGSANGNFGTPGIPAMPLNVGGSGIGSGSFTPGPGGSGSGGPGTPMKPLMKQAQGKFN